MKDRPPLLAEGGPPETAGHAAPKAKVNALIMTYPFDEALQMADLVSEITIVKKAGERDKPAAKTIFTAEVAKSFKGSRSPGDTIHILQEGNGKVEFNQTPMFQPGERYVLILKKAEDFPEDTYWILGGETGVYQIIDDQAIVKRSKAEEQLRSIEIEDDIQTKIKGILELPPTKETQFLYKEQFEQYIVRGLNGGSD